jgi:hypothetical protein
VRFGVSVVAIDLRNAVDYPVSCAARRRDDPRELIGTLPEGTGFYELRVEKTRRR